MNKKINELEEKILLLEQELGKMQEENSSYKKEQNAVNNTVNDIYSVSNELVMYVSKLIGDVAALKGKQGFTEARCNNLKYELLDPLFKREDYYFPIICSAEETIEEIIKNKKSMARFGDGEFAAIAKITRPKFQRVDEKLAIKLEEVLHTHHPHMIIAIANNYGSLDKYNEFDADGIRFYMARDNTRRQHLALLEHDRTYYDAYVSRPYVMYKDNMTDAPKRRFKHLKKIWNERNIIVVEGAQTRMGVGNNLLDNAKKVRRILAPAINSFDRYDEILHAALEVGEQDTLFLIAMGPGAGVLAYDLTVAGYQALDVGHIDLEYEWFLAGKGQRTPVLNKYNHEYKNGDMVGNIADSKYDSEIIVDLS